MKVTITPLHDSHSPESGLDCQNLPTLRLPPDKSILHRLLILGSLTHAQLTIPLLSLSSLGTDVLSTVLALEALGVPIDLFVDRIELQGVGLHGYRAPTHKINCANSGTTARLLMGLLAGQKFLSELVGDTSLSQRPMSRLSELLNHSFGAEITASPRGTLPLQIVGKQLRGAEVVLPVASAQMKSAVLLSGLLADGLTTVSQPGESRDHTERMLQAFGYEIHETIEGIRVRGGEEFELPDELLYQVPGDLSSAAFLIAASILLRKPIRIDGVLLNPTRTRFLEIVTLMGVELEISGVEEHWGEDRGTIIVRPSPYESLKPFEIIAEDIPYLIDEIPILAVLAILADGESTIRGAGELRLKESDRVHLLHSQLVAFGCHSEEHPDGLTIAGDPEKILKQCQLQHGGDHRLAMAFAVASLRSQGPCILDQAEVVRISYPEFFRDLQVIAGESHFMIEEAQTHSPEERTWQE